MLVFLFFAGCGVLVSGDDQGEVWVYDVFKQAELAESAKIKAPFKPNQVFVTYHL